MLAMAGLREVVYSDHDRLSTSLHLGQRLSKKLLL